MDSLVLPANKPFPEQVFVKIFVNIWYGRRRVNKVNTYELS